MARLSGHYGRPTYPALIDEDWAKHSAVTAERGFTSTVTMALPDVQGDEYDEETHSYPSTPGAVLYDGPGRIQSIGAGDESTVDLAGQQMTITRYRVSVPRTVALPPVGARIMITDPSMSIFDDGPIEVTVTAFSLASQRFQSDFLVESAQG